MTTPARTILVEPLTREGFAPFGEVIETDGAEIRLINGGRTQRFHGLGHAKVAGEDAEVLISIFRGGPNDLPVTLDLLERHPLGSQSFQPLSGHPFLVVAAPDENGVPGTPRAFLAAPHQGVNIGLGVWHGPLNPLEGESDFLVVDRGGPGVNFEEHRFDPPYTVTLAR